MKVGTESKTKLYAMIGLLSLAVLLLVRGFWPSGPGTGTVAASSPASVPAQPEAANERGRKGAPLDPTLQVDLLKDSEGAEYKGSGRNIFEARAERPPIPQPTHPAVTPSRPVVDPLPTPPPPIPLKFFGYASKPGQPKTIFLANGEDVFLAKEGDIVNRRYRIVHIAPLQVEVEDVLNNNRQTIPLTQG